MPSVRARDWGAYSGADTAGPHALRTRAGLGDPRHRHPADGACPPYARGIGTTGRGLRRQCPVNGRRGDCALRPAGQGYAATHKRFSGLRSRVRLRYRRREQTSAIRSRVPEVLRTPWAVAEPRPLRRTPLCTRACAAGACRGVGGANSLLGTRPNSRPTRPISGAPARGDVDIPARCPRGAAAGPCRAAPIGFPWSAVGIAKPSRGMSDSSCTPCEGRLAGCAGS